MFLFCQPQTIFPDGLSFPDWFLVPHSAIPHHTALSHGLRGATEPHTACSHGKTCRKKSLHYRYNFAAGKVAKSAKKFFIFLLL